jgi:hypothetical protein
MHRALEKLVELAKRNDVPLRQSYVRVAKRAAIMVGRYSHAHVFKRARRMLKSRRRRACQTLHPAARPGAPGADAGSPSTRPQDLFPAPAGGRSPT